MFQIRTKIDFVLLGSVLFITFAGLLTLYSQEASISQDSQSFWQLRWWKQMLWVVVGFGVAFSFRKMNYQALGMYALPAYGVIVFLLVLTRLFAPEINGARSWFRIGPVSFQASEFAKLITIVLVAKYLELKEREMEKISSLVIPSAIVLLPMLLVFIQPDLGGAMSFAVVLFCMLFIAGADLYYLSAVLILFGVSLSIPLYIEYHKITLVLPLINHLSELGKSDLVPAVRILRINIWDFIETANIPASVAQPDLSYLQKLSSNANLMQALKEAANSVQSNEGGIVLIFLQNTKLLFGIGLAFFVVALALLLFRYARGSSFHYLRKLYIPFGVLGVALLVAITFQTVYSFKYHQVLRILAFINPEQFPRDHSYQIIASKTAVGAGGLFGRGLFHGDMTLGRRPLVPEAFTDFIFASWSERMGFLGSLLLVLALIAIPLRGLQLAFEARDRFGSLLAAGISFLFFFHIIVNIGITLGLLPVTGIPLSFISYGGSHMLMSMAALGILLSIYKRKFANQ